MNLVYENSGPSLGMFQQLNFSETGCRTAQGGLFNSVIAAKDSNQERLYEASIRYMDRCAKPKTNAIPTPAATAISFWRKRFFVASRWLTAAQTDAA
jgi:hypothetical protein